MSAPLQTSAIQVVSEAVGTKVFLQEAEVSEVESSPRARKPNILFLSAYFLDTRHLCSVTGLMITLQMNVEMISFQKKDAVVNTHRAPGARSPSPRGSS